MYFFLLAIIQDVIQTPPDQQVRRFLGDATKFGVMIGILMNLWLVMGYIMQIADGITNAFSTASMATLTMPSALDSVINDVCEFPDFAAAGGIWDCVGLLVEWVFGIVVLFQLGV